MDVAIRPESDFSVTLEGSSDWVIVHRPTKLEILSLPCELFKDVIIEGEPTAPCIRTRRTIEGDVVTLPIKFSHLKRESQTLITVEMLGSERTVELLVNENDTVAHLKELLEGRIHIPHEEQSIWNGSVRIDDDRAQLSQCGITSRGAWVRVGKCGKLRITVRFNNVVAAKLLVLPSETVECVKEYIATKTNIPSKRQILLVAGRELPSRRTLRECRVTSNHEITVVLNNPDVTHPKMVFNDDSFPLTDRDMVHTVETMLGSVHSLVDQQAKLQSTVGDLVGSCSFQQKDYTNASTNMLSQSRQIRAAANTEAGATLRMLSQPGQLSNSGSERFSHRQDLMHYLSKEARQFSKDSVLASLDRMEQVRHEYNSLRNEINLSNLQNDDSSCKLCGHASKSDTAAAAGYVNFYCLSRRR